MGRYDYYPFGALKPGRIYSSSEYKFGFNSLEKDNEIKGNGNSINYGARIYDPRVSRFLSIDPISSQFPFYSPYQFAGLKPTWAIDLDGREELPYWERSEYNSSDAVLTKSTKFSINVAKALYNDVAGIWNYGVDVSKTGYNEGLSSAGQKVYNDGTAIASGLKDYATNTTFDEFKSDIGDVLTNPETYEQGVGALLTFGTGSALKAGKLGKLSKINNPVPDRVARVVPIYDDPIKTLGRKGSFDVFVTDPKDIIGLDAKGIAKRLSIPESNSGFQIFEFDTPNNITSPINRMDPGFIGKGRTAGGAKEFTIPNQKIPSNATKVEIK